MQLIPPLLSPLLRKLISVNPGLSGILNKIPLPKTHNWSHKVLMNAYIFLETKLH